MRGKEAANSAAGGKRKATGPADRVARADGRLQGRFLSLKGEKWRVLSVAWSVEFSSVMAWYYNVECAATMLFTHDMMEQLHEGATDLATEHPEILTASVEEIRLWAEAAKISGGNSRVHSAVIYSYGAVNFGFVLSAYWLFFTFNFTSLLPDG